VHCKLWFKPATLCPATFSFQFAKLLSNAAEPGGRLPLTNCAVAERGVFVKDGAKLSIEISDGCERCDGMGNLILFLFFTLNFMRRLDDRTGCIPKEAIAVVKLWEDTRSIKTFAASSNRRQVYFAVIEMAKVMTVGNWFNSIEWTRKVRTSKAEFLAVGKTVFWPTLGWKERNWTAVTPWRERT